MHTFFFLESSLLNIYQHYTVLDTLSAAEEGKFISLFKSREGCFPKTNESIDYVLQIERGSMRIRVLLLLENLRGEKLTWLAAVKGGVRKIYHYRDASAYPVMLGQSLSKSSPWT